MTTGRFRLAPVVARRAAVLVLVAALAGPLAIRAGLVTPLVGFAITVALAAAAAAVTTGASLVALRGPATPRRGVVAAGAVGAGAILLLALAGLRGLTRPRIHDITTNPDDPPTFTFATDPSRDGDDLAYPQGGPEVPRLQRDAYPEVRPIELEIAPAAAFDAAARAAADLGWSVTWQNRQLGLIEAYDVSAVFRFVDDVVVRVRPAGGGSGSVVDVRSVSRVGRSDLGANAARITRFAEALRARS